MLPKQAIDQERFEELRDVLGKIPGSQRKPWILEVYIRVDGQDRLSQVFDIKTGRSINAKTRKRIKA